MSTRWCTVKRNPHHIIIILNSLIHKEQLQSLLSDLRLNVTTTWACLLLPFNRVAFLFLHVVKLTDHLALAMLPDAGHALLGLCMPHFRDENGVGLTVETTHDAYM